MRGTLKSGALIQRTPDGETLATIASPSLIVLGERDREWVRVALEGWVRQSEVQGAVAPIPAITAAMLRNQPDRYVGQTVAVTSSSGLSPWSWSDWVLVTITYTKPVSGRGPRASR